MEYGLKSLCVPALLFHAPGAGPFLPAAPVGPQGPYFLGADISLVDITFASMLERAAASLAYYKGFYVRGKGRWPAVERCGRRQGGAGRGKGLGAEGPPDQAGSTSGGKSSTAQGFCSCPAWRVPAAGFVFKQYMQDRGREERGVTTCVQKGGGLHSGRAIGDGLGRLVQTGHNADL